MTTKDKQTAMDLTIIVFIMIIVFFLGIHAGKNEMREEIEDMHKAIYCDACHLEEEVK
jgi:hypothetical protein